MPERVGPSEDSERVGDYLSQLLSRGSGPSRTETQGDTLKVFNDRAWIPTIERDARDMHETLLRDSRFRNVRIEGGGSMVSLYADLDQPIGEISKVELHLSKEQ